LNLAISQADGQMNGKTKNVFLSRIRFKMWSVQRITNEYFGFIIALIVEYKTLNDLGYCKIRY
jgi:hypothetical protein